MRELQIREVQRFSPGHTAFRARMGRWVWEVRDQAGSQCCLSLPEKASSINQGALKANSWHPERQPVSYLLVHGYIWAWVWVRLMVGNRGLGFVVKPP